MSTNAMVAHKVEGGYECIYVHWDGYIDGVGKALKEAFNTKSKVAELISLGDCSSIAGATCIDEVESYFRDRNANGDEEWDDIKPRVYHTLAKAIDAFGNLYNYVWDNNTWTIYNRDGDGLSWDSDED